MERKPVRLRQAYRKGSTVLLFQQLFGGTRRRCWALAPAAQEGDCQHMRTARESPREKRGLPRSWSISVMLCSSLRYFSSLPEVLSVNSKSQRWLQGITALLLSELSNCCPPKVFTRFYPVNLLPTSTFCHPFSPPWNQAAAALQVLLKYQLHCMLGGISRVTRSSENYFSIGVLKPNELTRFTLVISRINGSYPRIFRQTPYECCSPPKHTHFMERIIWTD